MKKPTVKLRNDKIAPEINLMDSMLGGKKPHCQNVVTSCIVRSTLRRTMFINTNKFYIG